MTRKLSIGLMAAAVALALPACDRQADRTSRDESKPPRTAQAPDTGVRDRSESIKGNPSGNTTGSGSLPGGAPGGSATDRSPSGSSTDMSSPSGASPGNSPPLSPEERERKLREGAPGPATPGSGRTN